MNTFKTKRMLLLLGAIMCFYGVFKINTLNSYASAIETKTIYHTHTGTSGLTSASGCNDETYSSYEKTGSHNEPVTYTISCYETKTIDGGACEQQFLSAQELCARMGKNYNNKTDKQWAQAQIDGHRACNSQSHSTTKNYGYNEGGYWRYTGYTTHAWCDYGCVMDTSGGQTSGSYSTSRTVDDYGYVTRYQCTHTTSTAVGSITLNKASSNGSYVYSITSANGSGTKGITLTGYTYYKSGGAVGYSSSYTATSAGNYSVTVSYKDNKGGVTGSVTFNFSLSDADFNYTIYYNSNGGSAVSSQTVGRNQTFYYPTPTKTGYLLEGWYSNSGLTTRMGNGGLGVSHITDATSITLYAKWIPITYYMTFKDSAQGWSTQATCTYASAYTSPTRSRAGYTGVWNGGVSGISGKSVASAFGYSNLTTTNGAYLNADIIWTANKYTVNFNSNGGSAVSSKTCSYGTSTALPANPTRTGYVFSGWFTNTSFTSQVTSLYNLTTTNNGSVTLYAKWTPISYKVNFKDSVTGYNNTVTYVYDTSYTAPTVTRTGYTGVWNTGSTNYNFGSSIKNLTTTNGGTVTLNVVWTPIKYTVKFNTNGGSAISDATYTYDSTYTLPSTTRTGYTFGGWYTNGSLTNYLGMNGNSVKNLANTNGSTVNLYAKWNSITYYVTLDTNKGTIANESLLSQVLKYDGTPAVLPECSRSGYTFKGWMIKSGSDTYSNHGTATNPMTNGVSEYFKTSAMNLAKTERTVELVAIWEHTHNAIPNMEIALDKDNVPFEDYYYETNQPAVANKLGYWVNTNKQTQVPWKVKAEIPQVSCYYNIVEIGVKGTGDLSTTKVANTGYTADKTVNVLIDGNKKGSVYPYVLTTCTWEDNYNKCTSCINKETAFNDADHTISLMGDCDAPKIEGLELWQNLEGLDLNEFLINGIDKSKTVLTVTDDGSGINDDTKVQIYNSDNHLDKILAKTNSYTRGAVSSFKTPEIDLLVNKNGLVSDLFNGCVELRYSLIDNVGNTLDSQENLSIFNMEMEIESHTNIPSNTYTDGTNTWLDCVMGEAIDVTIKTMGYANAVRIEFPEEWYSEEEYPLGIYYGDDEYSEDLIEYISSDYFYLKTENDDLGNWEKTFTFILPLYAEADSFYEVKAIAYKGDVDYIDEFQIRINKEGGNTIENLERSVVFHVNENSILDENCTNILNTYRYGK